VAKTPRSTFPELPLSPAFYAALAQVGRRFALDVGDPERLGAAVAELSQTYTRERGELGEGKLGPSAPLARLGFFLPRDLVKPFGPLGELWRAGRLPARPRLRVLDLGAGLGATSLGTARFLRRVGSSVERIELTAIERDPLSTRLLGALCEAVSALPGEFVPLNVEARALDLRRLDARGPFDLVLLGFVLNELFLERDPSERIAARAGLLRALAATLAPDGALIVLEPALRESARELMQTRDAVLQGADAPFVFAPCVRTAPCPMLANERDWCHEALDFALPQALVPVARHAGLRYEGLSYAALVLTLAPRFTAPSPSLLRIVSDPRKSKGKLEYFGCSDGGYQRLTRLDREHSAANQSFEALRRGDVIEVEGTRITRETKIRKH
jgi:SAM-dependent methyltransferase